MGWLGRVWLALALALTLTLALTVTLTLALALTLTLTFTLALTLALALTRGQVERGLAFLAGGGFGDGRVVEGGHPAFLGDIPRAVPRGYSSAGEDWHHQPGMLSSTLTLGVE